MSGGISAMGIMAGAAVAGTAYSIFAGEKASKSQDKAQRQATAAASAQAKAADEAQNKANQRRPDTSAIMAAAQQSGMSGQSGTMLTGPAGVGQDALKLGKSTLLGS